MLAALAADPQVAAAARAAEEAVQSSGLHSTLLALLALLAYSDSSVIADGVEGSVAAVVRISDEEFSATVWLAAADRALSSGRSEWAGLLMVLCSVSHSPT